MKILALDTSSATTSIAVAQDDDIIAVRCFDAPRGRGAQLFTALEELRPQWSGADLLALGLGPGSYNGLRAACALAAAFQLSLGLRLVTLPSPCLLDVGEQDYLAVGDARGGRLWLAAVHGRRLQGGISLVSPEEFAATLAAGGAPAVYRVGPIAGADHLPAARPDARVLARLAPQLPAADPATVEPLYLKPPHITLPRAGRP